METCNNSYSCLLGMVYIVFLHIPLARTHTWSSPRAIGWETEHHPLIRRENYYLGRIMQSTTVMQLVSCATIQTWQSSKSLPSLPTLPVYPISKMVESNGERKILIVLLSYKQHGIKSGNYIETLKPNKRPWDKFKVIQGCSVSSSMYLQP